MKMRDIIEGKLATWSCRESKMVCKNWSIVDSGKDEADVRSQRVFCSMVKKNGQDIMTYVELEHEGPRVIRTWNRGVGPVIRSSIQLKLARYHASRPCLKAPVSNS